MSVDFSEPGNVYGKGALVCGSGRFYLDRNQWRGFSYAYGSSYYQISQSFGTGLIPVVNADTANGYLMHNGVVANFSLRVRCNSAEAVSYDYALIRVNSGSQVVIATLTDTSQGALPVLFNVAINEPVQVGDVLVVAGRKIGGNGTRRYGYASWSLLLE